MHEKLMHLSKDQIIDLMTRYYEGNEKVQDLISEYNLDVRPNGLIKLFPPQIHRDLLCPHCEVNLVTMPESRNSLYPNKPVCPECGHHNQPGCYCINCRNAAKQIRLNAEERKRDLIKAAFPLIVDLPSPDEISLKDAVYLLALSTHSLSEDLMYVEPYRGQIDLAPTFDFKDEIVKYLYAKGFISISNSSPVDAFVFDAAHVCIEAYYATKVIWDFMPGFSIEEKRDYLKQLRGIVKEAWPEEWDADIAGLWHQIAKYECIEYFLFLIEQRGYSIEKLGEKTHSVFEMLLEDYSVSRIFNLSWQAVRDTTDYIVRENLPKYHGKNIFIGAVQKKAERASAEGWEIRHARRDYNCPQTIISSTFFNFFLALGDKAFETVPPKLASVLAKAS